MGAGASSTAKEDAPFLVEAFDILGGALNDGMMAEVNGEEVNEAAMDELKKKYEDALQKSFDNHDTKKDQRLDKDETAVFLANLVEVSSGFIDACTKAITTQILKMMLKELKDNLGEVPELQEHLPQLGKICEAEFKAAEAAMLKRLEEKKAEYIANREDKQAAAMKVVDKDGSGCLSRDEFMTMMDLESESHKSLMEALGFTLDPEDYIVKLTGLDLQEKVEKYVASKVQPEVQPEE